MALHNNNIQYEYIAIPTNDACDVGICGALYAAPTIFIPASSISVVDDEACASVDIEANNADSTQFKINSSPTTTEKDYCKSGESSTVKSSYKWFTIGLLLLLLLDVVVMWLYQLKLGVITIGIAAINYTVLSLVDTYTSSKIVKNFRFWLALSFLINGIMLAMYLFMTFIH